MTRVPEPSREAQRLDRQALFSFGFMRSLLAYFAWPRDWWTQPYWPAGSAGKVSNFLRGRGWRVT